jgi:pyruvate formate lyase activating enzyme
VTEAAANDGGKATRATVFDIARGSTHDGPGIRTTVFFKGCYLRCPWCHNPESMRPGPELMFDASRCAQDQACAMACPNGAIQFVGDGSDGTPRRANRQNTAGRTFDAGLCRTCGRCVEVCAPQALEVAGREVTLEEVFVEVTRDRAYYERSGGGMTASGGEPLYQHAFVTELFALCREAGIHTALDTTAFGPWDRLEQVLSRTDLVLLDLKMMDPERHRAFTGVENGPILANAERLGEYCREGGCEPGTRSGGVWVRVPVIPSVNDDEANQVETIEFVKERMSGSVRAVELLGYHRMGGAKAHRLGYEARDFGVLPKERLRGIRDLWMSRLAGRGIEVRAR